MRFEINFSSRFRVSGFGFRPILRKPSLQSRFRVSGFGFRSAKEVLEAHRTLAPARQRVAGLCFSDEGRPWTILEVQETMQSEMAVLLDNPEEITTYSWRRMAPTLAQLLECRPEEMAALGDWQNKGDQPEVGHYSSAKYAASIKIKSLVWGAASKLTDQLSWEDPKRGAGQSSRAWAAAAEPYKILKISRRWSCFLLNLFSLLSPSVSLGLRAIWLHLSISWKFNF